MTDKTRDDFKTHMLELKKWPDDGHAFELDKNGDYALMIVEATFFGWQAATLAERERCAVLWERLLDFEVLFTAKEIAAAIRQGGGV